MTVTCVAFHAGGNSGGIARDGWAEPEAHGRWTVGPVATLRMVGLAATARHAVMLELAPLLVPPTLTGQWLEVSVNGVPCFEGRLAGAEPVRFELPAGTVGAAGVVEFLFRCPDATSPARLGISGDTRQLGFCFWQLVLTSEMAAVPLAAPVTAPLAAPVTATSVGLDATATDFRFEGFCPLCGEASAFVAHLERPVPAEWLPGAFRGALRCERCQSVPRERALFTVVERLYPDWRRLRMHESSPGDHGASRKFRKECERYVVSQYDPAIAFGTMHPSGAYRSEDLEAQTFADESFDIVITQDVFEHLFDPARAIREIARTLRPGGALIMTVPIVRGTEPSRRRASRGTQGITHLAPAEYHGNPMTDQGSLVTIDWGYDIVDFLALHSGLSVSMYYFDDLSRGMRAVCMEVIVCRKPGGPVIL